MADELPLHPLGISPFRDVPRYCLRCQQPLGSLWQAQCPRCRLQFDPHDPATYRTGPMFLRWKFWLPGLCLALASGVVSYAIVITTGEMGQALFLSVPISFGAILGYATRVGVWATVCLAIVAISAVVTALVSMSYAGLFCGAMLGLVFLPIVLMGILAGWLLRAVLKETRWDQRRYLPIGVFLFLPYACEAVENAWPRPAVLATIRTELTFDAGPREAWNSILFYEEVEHEPPWLLRRLSLPKPIRSEGSKAAVGNRVRCLYDRGYIVKQITERVEGKRLAFEVLEQKVHFERDVTLRDGSFEIEPIDDGRTRVVLTTRYVRHLRPAWMWQPIERRVVHALHSHVLEGMRRRAAADRGSPEEYIPHPAPLDLPRMAYLEDHP